MENDETGTNSIIDLMTPNEYVHSLFDKDLCKIAKSINRLACRDNSALIEKVMEYFKYSHIEAVVYIRDIIYEEITKRYCNIINKEK